MTTPRIFRIVAALLLLLTGVELCACEMLSPGQCESFGVAQGPDSRQADDSCICCCPHVIIAQPVMLHTSAGNVTILAPMAPPPVEKQSFGIYHPPKA